MNHPNAVPDASYTPYKVYYAEAVYGQAEIDAVLDVLENSPKTLMAGPRVRAFERRVAELFGKQYGLLVNSCSSANTLALASLELEAGAEIVTPALTFSTTVAPIVQQGYVPAFVDVEPDTFVVDVSQVEAMISPRTRALIIPNLLGNLPDWRALREIADRHDLLAIEDSADTIGSTLHGTNTGHLSDLATTSFYASHVITGAGFGGMISFNSEAFLRRALLLRGWGRNSSITHESDAVDDRFGADLDGIDYDAKFTFDDLGYNFMPSEICAAFGMVQLDSLPRRAAERATTWRRLYEVFSRYEDLFQLPRQTANVESPWLAFPLVVKNSAPFTRTELQVHFEQNLIQTRPIFTGNVLRQPGFKNIERRERPEGYPNADRVMRGGILIGCHNAMNEEAIETIASTFAALLDRTAASG